MQGLNELWFATSNGHKFEEARLVMDGLGFALKRLDAKGTEVQSDDVGTIARLAAKEAYGKSRVPLFVEDTGLFIESLKGFPGAYAAHAHRTLGLEGVLSLMKETPLRGAEFVSAVAFCGGEGEPNVFVGKLKGTISHSAKGTQGFGFDPIFIPEGRRETLAEMTLEVKVSLSHRSRALRLLGAWLARGESGQHLSA